jgi:hypothetical protein
MKYFIVILVFICFILGLTAVEVDLTAQVEAETLTAKSIESTSEEESSDDKDEEESVSK